MKSPHHLCLLLLAALLPVLSDTALAKDNRLKPINPGDPIPGDFVGVSEKALREKIAAAGDSKLSASIAGQKLRWQNQIALMDVDCILCLFAPDWRIDGAGDNYRTLVLFSPDYHLTSWGRFVCNSSFQFGTTMSPRSQSNTYFITVNQGYPHEGLWFEKYRVWSGGIEKLGEGAEVTKIPYSK